MQHMPASPIVMKWLTEVSSRGYSARFKLHRNLGHAKAALLNGYGSYPKERMNLWEWDEENNQWKLLFTWTYGEPKPW